MARTYRDRQRFTHQKSKVEYLKETWISRFTGIPEPLYKEDEWDKFTRDGFWSESGRNRGFRHDTNKLIRTKNRVDIHHIMEDPDAAEDMIFATKWHAKKFIWSYW